MFSNGVLPQATTAPASLNVQLWSVTPDQNGLGQTTGTGNDQAASFTIAGADQGDTFVYSIASSGGGATVSGTGTMSGASQDVNGSGSGIDLSSLPNGTLTYTVTLTKAGETAATLTATAMLYATYPKGYTIVLRPILLQPQYRRSGRFHRQQRRARRHRGIPSPWTR